MATIIDLKEHLENGGKIRRPFWKEGEWIRIFNHAFVDNACVGFPFLPEDALYCDWEVYGESKKPFKITHTGLYKTRSGRLAFVGTIEKSALYPIKGFIEGDKNITCWAKNGKNWDSENDADDIVSKKEN